MRSRVSTASGVGGQREITEYRNSGIGSRDRNGEYAGERSWESYRRFEEPSVRSARNYDEGHNSSRNKSPTSRCDPPESDRSHRSKSGNRRYAGRAPSSRGATSFGWGKENVYEPKHSDRTDYSYSRSGANVSSSFKRTNEPSVYDERRRSPEERGLDEVRKDLGLQKHEPFSRRYPQQSQDSYNSSREMHSSKQTLERNMSSHESQVFFNFGKMGTSMDSEVGPVQPNANRESVREERCEVKLNNQKQEHATNGSCSSCITELQRLHSELDRYKKVVENYKTKLVELAKQYDAKVEIAITTPLSKSTSVSSVSTQTVKVSLINQILAMIHFEKNLGPIVDCKEKTRLQDEIEWYISLKTTSKLKSSIPTLLDSAYHNAKSSLPGIPETSFVDMESFSEKELFAESAPKNTNYAFPDISPDRNFMASKSSIHDMTHTPNLQSIPSTPPREPKEDAEKAPDSAFMEYTLAPKELTELTPPATTLYFKPEAYTNHNYTVPIPSEPIQLPIPNFRAPYMKLANEEPSAPLDYLNPLSPRIMSGRESICQKSQTLNSLQKNEVVREGYSGQKFGREDGRQENCSKKLEYELNPVGTVRGDKNTAGPSSERSSNISLAQAKPDDSYYKRQNQFIPTAAQTQSTQHQNLDHYYANGIQHQRPSDNNSELTSSFLNSTKRHSSELNSKSIDRKNLHVNFGPDTIIQNTAEVNSTPVKQSFYHSNSLGADHEGAYMSFGIDNRAKNVNRSSSHLQELSGGIDTMEFIRKQRFEIGLEIKHSISRSPSPQTIHYPQASPKDTHNIGLINERIANLNTVFEEINQSLDLIKERVSSLPLTMGNDSAPHTADRHSRTYTSPN